MLSYKLTTSIRILPSQTLTNALCKSAYNISPFRRYKEGAKKSISHYEGYVSEAANVDVLLGTLGYVW